MSGANWEFRLQGLISTLLAAPSGTGIGGDMCDCIHLSRIATAVGHIQLPKEEASAKIRHAAMPT